MLSVCDVDLLEVNDCVKSHKTISIIIGNIFLNNHFIKKEKQIINYFMEIRRYYQGRIKIKMSNYQESSKLENISWENISIRDNAVFF